VEEKKKGTGELLGIADRRRSGEVAKTKEGKLLRDRPVRRLSTYARRKARFWYWLVVPLRKKAAQKENGGTCPSVITGNLEKGGHQAFTSQFGGKKISESGRGGDKSRRSTGKGSREIRVPARKKTNKWNDDLAKLDPSKQP